jgi:hypothetical protein
VIPLRDPEAGMAAVLLGLEKKLERKREVSEDEEGEGDEEEARRGEERR